MAKKKMTPAQAAAARRPDDWEPPQNANKSAKQKKAKVDVGPSTIMKQAGSKDNRKMYLGFILLFVVMAIAAPFLVIGVSSLFGISS